MKDRPRWRDRLSNLLNGTGLTRNDYNILIIINDISCLRKKSVDRNIRHSREASKRGVLPYSNRRDCESTIDKLIENNIIAHTNKNMLEIIVEHLISQPAYGPLYGLPDHDSIDLTLDGASLWEALSRS